MTGKSNSFTIQHPVIADPVIIPEEWEDFWHDAINGTVFNSLRFLSYHPQDRFKTHHVTFRRNGNLVGILPAVISEDEKGKKTWISHPGASYGGPVWSSKLRYHHLESLLDAMVEYARSIGVNQIRLTPPPVIYNEFPEQQLDFALQRKGFKVIRSELTQGVRLDVPESELLNSFVNKTRNAFRRAEKIGLKFREIENPTQEEFDRFWEILVENRTGLGVTPAHNRDEIELLHNLIPEHLMMAVVEYEGKIISLIWNFGCNRHTVLEFYMAHQEPFQKLRPVPFLTYHSILWARSKGYRYFDFGISSIDSDPTWGLLRFKENFNAHHFLRQTYQKNLEP